MRSPQAPALLCAVLTLVAARGGLGSSVTPLAETEQQDPVQVQQFAEEAAQAAEAISGHECMKRATDTCDNNAVKNTAVCMEMSTLYFCGPELSNWVSLPTPHGNTAATSLPLSSCLKGRFHLVFLIAEAHTGSPSQGGGGGNPIKVGVSRGVAASRDGGAKRV